MLTLVGIIGGIDGDPLTDMIAALPAAPLAPNPVGNNDGAETGGNAPDVAIIDMRRISIIHRAIWFAEGALGVTAMFTALWIALAVLT